MGILITLSFSSTSLSSDISIDRFDWFRCNFPQLQFHLLGVDWDSLFFGYNVEQCYVQFTGIFLDAFTEFVGCSVVQWLTRSVHNREDPGSIPGRSEKRWAVFLTPHVPVHPAVIGYQV